MKELAFRCWAKAQIAKQAAKEGVKNFFSGEDGGADGIVIAVLIIIIVIGLAIIFRAQITEWVQQLFDIGNEQIEQFKDNT